MNVCTNAFKITMNVTVGISEHNDSTALQIGIALAVILFFPQRLREFFRQKDLYYLFGAAGLFLLNAGISLFIGNSTLEDFCTPLFWILYPLAAVSVAGEIQKILPFFAGIAALILIYSGIVSENFTGLAGNWNWLQGFITALLPAIALWSTKERTLFPGCVLKNTSEHRRNRAIILLSIFFAGVGIFLPEILSRGAIAAAAATGIFLYFSNRIEKEKFFRYFIIFIAVITAGFSAGLLIFEFNDTRFIMDKVKFDKSKLKQEIQDYIWIVIGLAIYVVAFQGFMMPEPTIVGGGVTGIAQVIYYITNGFVPTGLSYFLINGILLAISLKVLGPNFGIKTVFAMCTM